MKRILIIFGTRPEAIKMVSLVKKFLNHVDYFETKICVTAQHREMLDQVLEFFEIIPDYDLNLMSPGQNLHSLTASIIEKLKPVYEDFSPDYTFVHGDTTTTMASSIAAFYSGSKVCHIEAGLRTFNKKSPFPEEINRQLVGRISDYHFAPTDEAKKNLLKENVSNDTILVTGNTVIDALFETVNRIQTPPSDLMLELEKNLTDRRVLLVTGHRRENHGDGFENICRAIRKIANTRKDCVVVYPVHLNPNVQGPVKKHLSGFENIMLIDPLPYPDFVWLMNRSYIIVTDSGGVQEEAPSLGKPVLVMRKNTERPEAINAGTVILVGTDEQTITSEVLDLLSNESRYKEMSNRKNPYGDGRASERIVNFLMYEM